MRERWAKLLAVLTGALVLALAAIVALVQSRSQPIAVVVVAGEDRVARGRALFEAHGCASCHSIGGLGSPRYPLDDLPVEATAASLRDWIVADASIADRLPRSARVVKEDYRQLTAAELDALTAYLLYAARSPATTHRVDR